MSKVALINITGNITYESDAVALFESFFSSGAASEYAGLIAWINSGGGSFCAAQDMSEALAEAGVPSVAVVGEVCASAAYYLALGFGRIVARPGSLVGGLCASLDVANHSRLYDRLGICKQGYTNGVLKHMLSPHAGASAPGEEQAIKNILDDLDGLFHGYLRERRPQVDLGSLADGRLVSGVSAYRAGLVDALGGVPEATRAIANALGVETVEVELIEPEAGPTQAPAALPNELAVLLANALRLS